MRDQAEVSSGVATTTHDVDAGALYIITLKSSTAPMALEAPEIPELTGLAVFRSRRIEDGRDRFRLHLGYFDSVAAAEAILPVVRKHYPAAWVGPAPTSGMGSLDDTSVAQFKFIRAPKTIVREAPASTNTTPAPAAPAATASTTPIQATLVAPRNRAAPAAPVSIAAKPAVAAAKSTAAAPKHVGAKGAPAAKSAAAKAAPGRVPANPASHTGKPAAAPVKTPNPAAVSAGAAPAQRGSGSKPLAPGQVLNLLESGSPDARSQARAPLPPAQRAQVIGSIQRFAVQIVWSMDPIDLSRVPKLAIFDAYTLYKVQVDRAGRRWYGLRLGFFSDPVSARQVALYARSDFSAAAVVPVSDRECERAQQAAITEFPRVEEQKVEDRITLFEDPPAPPRNNAPAQRVSTPKKAPTAAASAPKPKPAPAVQRAEKKPKVKTPRELAEELEALKDEPDFTTSDPLNDTGVRHLAVNVVKKSRLSSLLGLAAKIKGED